MATVVEMESSGHGQFVPTMKKMVVGDWETLPASGPPWQPMVGIGRIGHGQPLATVGPI